MEDPDDAALLDGDDDRLVRVEPAFAALRLEAIHDHAVPLARRDVDAVVPEGLPCSGRELVEVAAQRRDPLGPVCDPDTTVSSGTIQAALGATTWARAVAIPGEKAVIKRPGHREDAAVIH